VYASIGLEYHQLSAGLLLPTTEGFELAGGAMCVPHGIEAFPICSTFKCAEILESCARHDGS